MLKAALSSSVRGALPSRSTSVTLKPAAAALSASAMYNDKSVNEVVYPCSFVKHHNTRLESSYHKNITVTNKPALKSVKKANSLASTFASAAIFV